MLRIEVYPVLDGLCVSVTGIDHQHIYTETGVLPTRVQRTIPVETIEALGVHEAVRDSIVDCIVLYPGLVKLAFV